MNSYEFKFKVVNKIVQAFLTCMFSVLVTNQGLLAFIIVKTLCIAVHSQLSLCLFVVVFFKAKCHKVCLKRHNIAYSDSI